MRVTVLVLTLMSITAGLQGQVTKQPFGKTSDGTAVDLYTIRSGALEARIMTYGGIVVSLKVPDKNGKSADVVLGYDSLDGYLANSPFFGALVGRYANRIGGAKFVLDGKTYSTPKNDGVNTLHGGPKGIDKAVWKAKEIPHGIELTHVSPDGDSGFPGNLTIVVRYTLSGKDLKIEYSATTDKNTVINLTVIGARIDNDNDQLKKGHGYDHNWVLDSGGGKLSQTAEVYETTTGRVMQVWTDQPGIQFYTGNFLDGTITGKGGGKV